MPRTTEEQIQTIENGLTLLNENLKELREQFSKEKTVARRYATVPSKILQDRIFKMTTSVLLEEAKAYANWLEEKTTARGDGAAADSGEAQIVSILRELCVRLESGA